MITNPSPSVASSRRFPFKPLKIVERLRRAPAPAQSAAGLRPLLLSTKFPAPYNPLATIDARQAAAAPAPAEPIPTRPVIVVSTSTSFHSLSSIEDVVAVLKTIPTSPAVDDLLLTPIPARARPSTRKARRITKAHIQPHSASAHHLALSLDDRCPRTPRTPRLIQDPFLQRCYRAVKKVAPPPRPAPTTPLPSTPVSSVGQAQHVVVGPCEPLLIPMGLADAERFYAQKAALITQIA